MKITFLGAAKTVTGSNFLVTLEDGTKFIVDCGMYQGKATDELKNEKWYNPKTRKMESAVYHCRSDRKGVSFDKAAMIKASEALGHGRLDVVAGHYIR